MRRTNKANFHRVVIVGGGFGGVKAALELCKVKRLRVTLVSDRKELVYYPLLYATATGSNRKISSIPLQTIVGDKPIAVVHDRVVGLDVTRKRVVGETGQYEYDDAVFAMGVVTNYFGIEGLENYSLSIKSPELVREFRQHLHEELLTTKHFDKHYVVVGAGPTGVELSSSLKHYLLRVGAAHGVTEHRVNITLIEAADRVLPRAGVDVSQTVLKRLHMLGVQVLLNTPVKKLNNETLVAGKRELSTETVVWTSGVANHPFFAANEPVFHMAESGKVMVNEYLEASPHVFVIGDNAATPHAGLAQTALYDACFVARAIQRRLEGKAATPYVAKRPFAVVPVGHNWAALERGRLRLYGWVAALIRRVADLKGYAEILPLSQAVSLWLRESDQEEFACELCQKNNDSSSVARHL